MTPEQKAAADKAKADAERQALNDALNVDWDTLEGKLNTKVKVFLEHLGRHVKNGNAESTAEVTVNDKPYYFTLSMRSKAPPEPKKFPRFVMWEGNKVSFAFTELERSTFLDANPTYQYAQIPQE